MTVVWQPLAYTINFHLVLVLQAPHGVKKVHGLESYKDLRIPWITRSEAELDTQVIRCDSNTLMPYAIARPV